jgi:threonine dehydrogenase-like Zn-dependent dehydrogenase
MSTVVWLLNGGKGWIRQPGCLLPKDEEIGVFLPNFNTAYNGVLDANVPLGGDVVVMGLGVVGQLVVNY